MTQPFNLQGDKAALVALVLLGIACRAIVWNIYQPAVYPDSHTYTELASQIATLNFVGYEGWRTPGYPLLLLITGGNLRALWLAQAALGVLGSVVLYRLVLRYTGTVLLAFAAGACHSLALNQVFLEASVLSESMAAFCVVVCVALSLRAMRDGASALHGILAGSVTALAALTRPLYIFLVPLFILLLFMHRRHVKVTVLAGYTLAAALPVLGWMLFNQMTVGYFGMSTMTGYNLSTHSGRFIEKASDKYATIRDIYLKHRAEQLKVAKTSSFTIFYARDEIKAKTGLSEADLSRELEKMSKELFIQHPGLYLRSVVEAWLSFWPVPNYWQRDKLTSDRLAGVLDIVWKGERYILIGLNMICVLAGALILLRAVARPFHIVATEEFPLVLACTVLGSSILTAAVVFGENPRYSIPTQPLATTLALLALWRGWRAWLDRSEALRLGPHTNGQAPDPLVSLRLPK